jgi:hypothetical protein
VDRAKFDTAYKLMKKRKMTGIDEVPIEAYDASADLMNEMFLLTQLVFGTELTSQRLNMIVQFMLYKGQGKDPEARKSYRPLSMICHARKLMAMIVLIDLQTETGAFIPENFNGFRKGHSCDDTLTALTLAMTYLRELGYEILLLFIDLEGAFDKCSWRAIGAAAAAAGASAKSIAMLRTLYKTAQGVARVRKHDGETVDSDPYDIRKSVLQGDTLSPWLFLILTVYVLNMTNLKTGRKAPSELDRRCVDCAAAFYRDPGKRDRAQCGVCTAVRRASALDFGEVLSSSSEEEDTGPHLPAP